MNYFTPHLFLRLQDPSDERGFLAAHEEWERAIETYRTHLRSLPGELPRSVRRMLELDLHDAEVVSIHRGARTLTIALLPELSPSMEVALTYSLLGEPEIDREALPPQYRSPRSQWLYDEIDTTVTSGLPAYSHNILLSNGWEMKIPFIRLSLSERERLFPELDVTGTSTRTRVPKSA